MTREQRKARRMFRVSLFVFICVIVVTMFKSIINTAPTIEDKSQELFRLNDPEYITSFEYKLKYDVDETNIQNEMSKNVHSGEQNAENNRSITK